MPEFVVSQDMLDYVKYNKKLERERLVGGLLAILVTIAACGMGYMFLSG